MSESAQIDQGIKSSELQPAPSNGAVPHSMRRAVIVLLLSLLALCGVLRWAWVEVENRELKHRINSAPENPGSLVTFAELLRSPESYAGKQITITCFVSSNGYGETKLYRKLKDSFLEEQKNGLYLLVDDRRLVFGETPAAVPSHAKVTGIFRVSPNGREGLPYLGILERIEEMQILKMEDKDLSEGLPDAE